MAEPASGTVAAITALGTTATGVAILDTLLPLGSSPVEFLWGMGWAMFGSFCWEFIQAGAKRQAAIDQGVPASERPTIDRVMVGYAMAGAPLSAAFLIFAIHQFRGMTGFGDPSFMLSAVGFMVAGPTGPKIVIKAVGTIVTLVSSRIGGKTP